MERGKFKTVRPLAPVYRLLDYRKTEPLRPKPLLFYINSKDELRKKLEKISNLHVFSIQSMPDFHTALSIKSPELVLIESDLKWCSPLEVLHETHRFFDVPSVLFCRDRKSFQEQNLIREAYKNGLYDVLFSPLNADDLCDSLTIILRLKADSGNGF